MRELIEKINHLLKEQVHEHDLLLNDWGIIDEFLSSIVKQYHESFSNVRDYLDKDGWYFERRDNILTIKFVRDEQMISAYSNTWGQHAFKYLIKAGMVSEKMIVIEVNIENTYDQIIPLVLKDQDYLSGLAYEFFRSMQNKRHLFNKLKDQLQQWDWHFEKRNNIIIIRFLVEQEQTYLPPPDRDLDSRALVPVYNLLSTGKFRQMSVQELLDAKAFAKKQISVKITFEGVK